MLRLFLACIGTYKIFPWYVKLLTVFSLNSFVTGFPLDSPLYIWRKSGSYCSNVKCYVCEEKEYKRTNTFSLHIVFPACLHFQVTLYRNFLSFPVKFQKSREGIKKPSISIYLFCSVFHCSLLRQPNTVIDHYGNTLLSTNFITVVETSLLKVPTG